MKTSKLAISLMVVCTLFTSTAQLLYKFGLNQTPFNFFEIISSPYIWFGLLLYALGSLLLVLSLQKGELSVLYPIVSTSYVWVFLFSVLLLNEAANILKFVGVGFIIFGVALVGRGSK